MIRRQGPENLGDDFIFSRGGVGRPELSSWGKEDCKRDSGEGRNNRGFGSYWAYGKRKEPKGSLRQRTLEERQV